MSLTNTTLAGDLSADALVLSVTSATGAVVGMPVKVDNEYIGAILEINGTKLSVRGRGSNGTKAVAHDTTAPVTFCAVPSDFPRSPQFLDDPLRDDQVFMDADGAIAVPTRNTVVYITKGSAIAATLAVPSAGSDGVKLRIIGLTDFAHVVTVGAAFYDGTNGGNTILTSAAFKGSSVELIAVKGVWVLVGGATNSGPWVAT